MANWQTFEVQTNGIHLHGTRTGGDKPALVLAHGITDDGLCWSPVTMALESEYEVIMLDARGHGHSEAPASGFGLTTLAEDLAGAIHGLGLQKPFILGHSMGAATTLLMAALHPETPGAIALEDPPSWWVSNQDPEAEQRFAFMLDQIKQEKTKSYQEILDGGRAMHPSWSQVELEPWARSKQEYDLDVILGIFAGIRHTEIDWNGLLPRITCPVLALPADPTFMAALTPQGVEALRKLVPQVQIVNIPGVGHNIRREGFTPYIKAVREFFAGVK
jgi:pimeloyl-ACP methyl ester carboxylesterase